MNQTKKAAAPNTPRHILDPNTANRLRTPN